MNNWKYVLFFIILQWNAKRSRMKLVIMTRPTFFVEEDKILASLFEEGLDDLHIFKPGASPVYVERLLSLLSEGTHRKITVHDHYYLKEEFGLAGIHLDSATAVKPSNYKGNISCSCRDLSILKESKRKMRYVFLHNIFDSLSAPDEKSCFTMTELENASADGLIDRHVYALGGITLDQLRLLRDLGFGGVVICGDLWQRFDIHRETDYLHILSHYEKLRTAIG